MTMSSNIKHFHSNLLKVDEKSYKDIDVYYIGYIAIKKFGDWENIQCKSVVFNNALCYRIFYRKDNKKYLIVDIKKFGLELHQKLKHLMVEKNCMIKKHARIGINIDDDFFSLNKPLKFPTLTIIIRFVFQEGEKSYPQIYLDECFYELQTMVQFDRVQDSERIDLDKTDKSKERKI